MKSRGLRMGIIVAAALCCATWQPLAAQTQGKSKPGAKPAGESFAVVQVGDDVRVVKSSEVGELRTKVYKDYQTAMRAYQEARKKAIAAKESFTEPRPPRPVFRELSRNIRTEEEAQKVREVQLARLQKAAQRKNGAHFIVVRVGDDYQVVTSEKFAQLRDTSKEDYRRAIAAYEEAKKKAAKSGEKFTEPRPRPDLIRPLHTFPTSEEAEKYIQKLKEKEKSKKVGRKPSEKRSAGQ